MQSAEAVNLNWSRLLAEATEAGSEFQVLTVRRKKLQSLKMVWRYCINVERRGSQLELVQAFGRGNRSRWWGKKEWVKASTKRYILDHYYKRIDEKPLVNTIMSQYKPSAPVTIVWLVALSAAKFCRSLSLKRHKSWVISQFLKGNQATTWNRGEGCPSTFREQPRSQALSSPERMTLVGSGHVPPRFQVVTNKIIEFVCLFWRKHNLFLSTLG